jgi:hypothetical protein
MDSDHSTNSNCLRQAVCWFCSESKEIVCRWKGPGEHRQTFSSSKHRVLSAQRVNKLFYVWLFISFVSPAMQSVQCYQHCKTSNLGSDQNSKFPYDIWVQYVPRRKHITSPLQMLFRQTFAVYYEYYVEHAITRCDNLILGIDLRKQHLLTCALAAAVVFEILSVWSYALRETMVLLAETVLNIDFRNASQ